MVSTHPSKARIGKIEAGLASNKAYLMDRGRIGPEDIATITDFEHRVRKLKSVLAGEREIDAMPSGTDASEFEARSLELALTEWMRDLDGRFNVPAKRVDSVSM